VTTTTPGAALRVVLAEDAPLIRDGLVALLASGRLDVVATVGDADALEEAVDLHRPDVAVTDVRMPPGDGDDGLRAAVRIRSRIPAQPVLVLSQYVAGAYAHDLLADGRGGVGYLLKEQVADADQLLAAIRTVVGGGTVIDPEVVQVLLGRRRASPLDRLSPREREVLALVAQGRSNAEIAAVLVLTEAAIAKNVGSILAKLDLPPGVAGHRRVRAVLAWLEG
jgi:DNA-binding NarL/FixJ family response regulator